MKKRKSAVEPVSLGTRLAEKTRAVANELSDEEMLKVLERTGIKLDSEAKDWLVRMANGDARQAITVLENTSKLYGNPSTTAQGGERSRSPKINVEALKNTVQNKFLRFDKKGDEHYNTVSAFIKSMRGSDASATLYYLARMLDGGEDPKFVARRMVIFASEDVGLAASAALTLAVSTFQAVERIGMPECQYNLFHCATVMAKTKKSREVANAMGKAIKAAKDFPNAPVPLHLRNAPTKLMKDLGYQKGTKWEADFKPPQGFSPDELQNLDFFS